MSKPMPDAFTKRYGDVVAVVANKKARRFINKSIEPPPRWRSIADSPGNVLKSPEYRALEFENPAAGYDRGDALRSAWGSVQNTLLVRKLRSCTSNG
jgi:hypothetical protein